jgi:hypothetical protein
MPQLKCVPGKSSLLFGIIKGLQILCLFVHMHRSGAVAISIIPNDSFLACQTIEFSMQLREQILLDVEYPTCFGTPSILFLGGK